MALSVNPVPDVALGAESVRSVERAVELLFLLVERGDRGVSLAQLALQVGCSKSTVHRLLATLERLGVAEREPGGRGYRLGQRARLLAPAGGWTPVDLRQVALPLMRSLRDLSEESVALHALDDVHHVVLEQVESPHEVRRVLHVGQRLSLLTGATSRALLSALGAAEAEAILSRLRTSEEPGPSAEELADIRAVGWAFSFSARVPGGSAIAAPILDGAGQVRAALSIQGPRFRFTHARAARCAPALLDATRRLSVTLGAR